MSVSGSTTRFLRSFGLAWRPPITPADPMLGLVANFTEIERDPADPVVAGFSINRIDGSLRACSVAWRVEGTGTNPISAEHFNGGVFPGGIASLAAGSAGFGAAILISAGDPPPTALTGRIVLENPVNCTIAPDRAQFPFSIAAGEIVVGDAIVGLLVGFSQLVRDPSNALACPFQVIRSGNQAVTCSVQWRVEGTGTNPVLGADFVGGVLPSGSEIFSVAELVEQSTFSLTAGAPPATARTGRIVLRLPVSCRIDPASSSQNFSIRGGAIPASVWDFKLANMAIHANVGQENRVSFGGSEATGYSHRLNLGTHRFLPTSGGGDLWCSAQASTGAVYTFCGDGPDAGYRSLAMAQINGTTLNSLSLTWLIGGPSPSILGGFETRPGYTFEEVGGNSYIDGKTTTCACRGDWLYYFVAEAGQRGWAKSRLFRRPISSLGTPATVAGWGFGSAALGGEKYDAICPALLIAGKNQDDAEDAFQYCLVMRHSPVENPDDSPRHFPAQHWLARFPLDGNWLTDDWQWLTAVSPTNLPSWGTFANRMVVPGLNLPDYMGWRPSWFFNKPIQRYILQNEHGFVGESVFWTIMAPKPWGPWQIIDDRQYTAAQVATDLAQLHIIPSTLSADGLTWLTAAWGGSAGGLDSDLFIATSSTLTPITVGGIAGLIVTGDANDDEHNLAVWFKSLPPQNYEIVFEYEKNEDTQPVDPGDRFVQIWIAHEGASGRPVDVTTWTTAQYRPPGFNPAGDSVYGQFGRGGRISFDIDSPDVSRRDEARLGMWSGGAIVRPTPTPNPPRFFLELGTSTPPGETLPPDPFPDNPP